MGDFSHKKHEAEKRVKFFADRVGKIEADIAELESKVARQKERAEAAARAAEEVCPRVVTERSRQSICSEIEKLKRRIEEELPEREEQERIEKEYVETMDQYKKTLGAIKRQQEALKVK